MMGHLKRILGFTHRVKPVTLDDVSPAPQDPKLEREMKEARTDLIQGVMALERTSSELRNELSLRTLELVINGNHASRGRRNGKK